VLQETKTLQRLQFRQTTLQKLPLSFSQKKIFANLPKLNRSKTSANFIRVKTQKEMERQIAFENIGWN
jgi:hypothetical protein